MLVQFSVKNYKSFRDLNVLSTAGVRSFKEHLISNTIAINEKDRLLKTVALYGNNASGKSNFLNAISIMKGVVINSFGRSLDEKNNEKFPLIKFLLNTKSEAEPTTFEIVFLLEGVKYRYGFRLDFDKVIEEWLFQTNVKEVQLFKREEQKLKINKSAFAEGVDKEKNLLNSVLFLTLNAQLKGELSSRIVHWFINTNHITGLNDRGYNKYTTDKLKKDANFHHWVSQFLRYLEITNVSTREDETKPSENAQKDKKIVLETHHRAYNEDNVFVDTIPFHLDYMESEGTKKILYLLGPWYDTLRNGKILFVDELDSRLHPNMTKALINFFHKFNKNKAQLIFATHDISILTHKTFRRDQIWFVEKDQFGASQLFSMADFKTARVRNKSAFDKNYLSGKYGAIPYFETDDKLINLLYDKEGA